MACPVIGVNLFCFEYHAVPPKYTFWTSSLFPNLLRGSVGNESSLVKNGYPFCDSEHHRHVVLRKEDGDSSLVAQLPDQRHGGFRLFRRHPARGFIEKEDLRLRSHGDGELQPFLVSMGDGVPLTMRLIARPISSRIRNTSS